METNTKDSTKMVNSTGKENIHGRMVHAMRVSLLRESGKARVAGDQPRTMEIYTLELTRGIRKMDMADMYGPMDVSTKVDLPTTSSNCYLIQARQRQADLSGWQRSERNMVRRQPDQNR